MYINPNWYLNPNYFGNYCPCCGRPFNYFYGLNNPIQYDGNLNSQNMGFPKQKLKRKVNNECITNYITIILNPCWD